MRSEYMAAGWKPDEIPLEDLPRLARYMRDEFRLLHEKVATRRDHRYNDEKVDPQLSSTEGGKRDPNDPFFNIRGFQVDNLRRKSTEFVARVTENPWQFSVDPPDETQTLERIANDIGQIMTYWAEDDERRQGRKILKGIAEAAVRDAYAVWHDLRCEHYWPEIEWQPGDGAEMSEGDVEVECPGCGGDGDECPQCAGIGTITKSMLTLKGRAKYYTETVTREYADRGSPWMWGVDDVLNVAWQEDNDPRGGFRRVLVTYEVLQRDYEGEVGADAMRTAIPLPGTTIDTTFSEQTPNVGGDWDGNRIQVNQLWTRSHYYEWTDRGASNNRLVKHGRHNYARIPYYLVAPLDTGARDLVRRFESPLDGLYRIKAWVDRQITLLGAVSENQAFPMMTDELADASVSPLLPDGTPANDNDGTLAARYTPAGMTTKVISQPMPAALPNFVTLVREMLEEASPDTGKVEVGTSSTAWAVRLGQQQASTLPRIFVDHIGFIMENAMHARVTWHIDNGQRMIGYAGGKKNRPVVVMPEEMRNHTFKVFINPVSGAERITVVEHNRGLLQEQLILPVDFYEAMGERDPEDAAARVKAYYLAQPFMDTRARAKMGEKMGSAFLLGPGLEMLDSQGNGVSPEQVLAAKGYQSPGGQQGGGGMPGNMLGQLRSQTQMPDLQPLERGRPGEVEMTQGMPG